MFAGCFHLDWPILFVFQYSWAGRKTKITEQNRIQYMDGTELTLISSCIVKEVIVTCCLPNSESKCSEEISVTLR